MDRVPLGAACVMDLRKEELPEGRESRLRPFVAGVALYNEVLLAA